MNPGRPPLYPYLILGQHFLGKAALVADEETGPALWRTPPAHPPCGRRPDDTVSGARPRRSQRSGARAYTLALTLGTEATIRGDVGRGQARTSSGLAWGDHNLYPSPPRLPTRFSESKSRGQTWVPAPDGSQTRDVTLS